MNPLKKLLSRSRSKNAKAPREDHEEGAFAALSQLLGQGPLGDKKTFDWSYYDAITNGVGNAMFNAEFMATVTTRVTKGMYLMEPWIHSCVFALQKQFWGPTLYLERKVGKSVKRIDEHPFLDYYYNASKRLESSSYFTANGITDLCLTGNAYWWNSPDKKMKRRIPSERIEPVIVNNAITQYRIVNTVDQGFGTGATQVVLSPDQVTHIKLPNPFSSHYGLPLIIAVLLPVLIDKYGMEYIVAFFLRGGNTAGVLETDTSDMGKVTRLARSIMQAIGGRRNMHADKVLPKGVTWKASSNTFKDLQIIELMKSNLTHFKAALGVNNTVLGISENVNKATAYAEMEQFWLATILPMQNLWTAGIENSDLWDQFGLDDEYTLKFDNSNIPYLNDLDQRLDQDKKFASTITINERRERLGYKTLGADYDKLEKEISGSSSPFGALGLSAPEVARIGQATDVTTVEAETEDESTGKWKATELEIQEPSLTERSLFQQEFDAWQQIIILHLEDRSTAKKQIHDRAPRFASNFTTKAMKPAMKAYDNQAKHAVAKAYSRGLITKENETDRKAKFTALRVRAQQVLDGTILAHEATSFLGYTDTMMDRVYAIINERLDAGDSLTDIASVVRQEFKQSYNLTDAYEGQAETIVRQEYGSAISLAQAQFGSDLADETEEMEKDWFTMGDSHVRASHEDCEKNPIQGKSQEVVDKKWPNGLRYPRDPDGEAGEVIGCRCTHRYTPIKWK